jgi:hypothetical protein
MISLTVGGRGPSGELEAAHLGLIGMQERVALLGAAHGHPGARRGGFCIEAPHPAGAAHERSRQCCWPTITPGARRKRRVLEQDGGLT